MSSNVYVSGAVNKARGCAGIVAVRKDEVPPLQAKVPVCTLEEAVLSGIIGTLRKYADEDVVIFVDQQLVYRKMTTLRNLEEMGFMTYGRPVQGKALLEKIADLLSHRRAKVEFRFRDSRTGDPGTILAKQLAAKVTLG